MEEAGLVGFTVHVLQRARDPTLSEHKLWETLQKLL